MALFIKDFLYEVFNKNKQQGENHVQITGDDARNVAEFLYKDSSIRLDRKYNKTRCLEKEKHDLSNTTS